MDKVVDEAATAERRSVQELLDDRYLLDALLEHSPDHIYFKDTDSRFVRVSRSLAEWMGLSDPLDAIGRCDGDFFAPRHAKKAQIDERAILRTGKALVGIEEREVWPDGRETWVSTTKAPLHDRNGNIIGIFGMSRDITARKAAEEVVAAQAARLAEQAQLLQDLAITDELTGLRNRRGFFEAATERIALAQSSGHRAVLFFVDLDGLKQINDTHGHHVGDQALILVAHALRNVSPNSVAGRIGGDEFCLIQTAEQTASLHTAAEIAEAIAAAASDSELFPLHATVGCVEAQADEDLNRLLARSDAAMYSRKPRRAS